MKSAWLTDPHLNFISRRQSRKMGETLRNSADALIVTGDIAEIPTLRRCLRDLTGSFGKPVYFVLGNHDFYYGSFSQGKRIAQEISGTLLHWLSRAGVIELDKETAIVGHDGWYDAQYGSPFESRFEMSDWTVISDLAKYHHSSRIFKFREMGILAAEEAEPVLREAAAKYRTVIFATHYPPFPQASWHRGQPGDVFALPWYTCKAIGDLLLRNAEEPWGLQIDRLF
jgi:predicted phosphohydrolase